MHGILRVPPQTREPLLSVLGNLYAPKALQWAANNAGLLAASLVWGGAGALAVWAVRRRGLGRKAWAVARQVVLGS